MKRVRVSRILGFVVVLSVITLFAGCGGGGGGGGGGGDKGFAVVIYVDQNATGNNDGNSWADAYTDLQAALLNADGYADEIWVAQGTYKPTAGTDRIVSFTLIGNVAIYGGFSGSESSRTMRDVNGNQTILSGDIGTAGYLYDNTYHVVRGADKATLDGFTITGGCGDWVDLNHEGGGGMLNFQAGSPTVANCIFTNNYGIRGGGMENAFSSPVMTNCTFTGNTSTNRGGGMYNNSSSPTITGCTFSGNSASQGGGLYNSVSSPTLTDCSFSGNTATNSGGGIFGITSSSPTITGCTFSGNSADYRGGGIYVQQDSSPTVTNCAFSGNTAQHGGGMYTHSSDPAMTNCTFSENAASSGGSGMYSYDNSHPTVTNCIFWNYSAAAGSQIFDGPNSDTALTYSCVQGGTAEDNNITVDPELGSGLTLQEGSPCIDAGDNSMVPSGTTIDLSGNPRISGSTVDMGAYEYQQ